LIRNVVLFAGVAAVAWTAYEAHLQGTPSIRKASDLAAIGATDPGLAAEVVAGDRVIIRELRGIADGATGSRIDGTTAFDLASLSKQLTAYVVLILEEQGRIDRTATLDQYVPNLPGWAQRVRIEHLLAHTSGLPSLSTLCLGPGGVTNDDVIERLRTNSALRFEPGTRFEYSNTGYEVLASVVESVLHRRFPDVLRALVLNPLGIRAAGHRAVSYNSWPFRFAHLDNPCNTLYGDGKVYLGLDDYRRWLQEVEQPTLVAPATWARALATGSYAYGWAVTRVDGELQLEHRGTWLGFRNYVVGVPARRVWLMVLSNEGDLDREAIVHGLIDRAKDQLPIRLDPQTLAGFK
jgi:CubicO group peptidase (beta-lactamase class C family)